jgi:hypothetical protein
VAVKIVESREPGSRSQTPPRLVFATDAGIDRDLGYDQQRFANDFTTIPRFSRGRLATAPGAVERARRHRGWSASSPAISPC